MKTTKIAFMMVLIYLTIFATGVSIQDQVTVEVSAKTYEAGEIVSYLDVEARNITYAIAPASGVMLKISSTNFEPNYQSELELNTFSLDRINVRAGTIPYSILDENNDNYPVMHNGNQEFLKAYYSVAKLTGEYRISQLSSLLDQRNDLSQLRLKVENNAELASLQTALSLMAETNDTTDTSGFVAKGEAKFALEDLRGKNNVVVNVSNPAQTFYSSDRFEPQYQQYADYLSGNTSETDFVKKSDLDDKKTYSFAVSGFHDIEEDGFLTTLRANLAANHSTASDQIIPSRVKILDYTTWGVNMTQFFNEKFQKGVHDAIEEYESDLETASNSEIKIQAKTEINFWGLFKIQGPMRVIPVSGGFFDFVQNIADDVVSTATTIINDPGKVLDVVKDTVVGFGDYLSDTVDTRINQAKALVNAAVREGDKLIKGGQEFVGWVGNTLVDTGKTILDEGGKLVDGVINEGQKLINGPISFVAGVGKGFMDTISNILLLAGAGLGLLLVAYVAFKYITRSNKGNSGGGFTP